MAAAHGSIHRYRKTLLSVASHLSIQLEAGSSASSASSSRPKDGGKNWIKQKSPVEVSFVSGESRNLFALLFPGPENGWAFGLDGVVLKTRGGSALGNYAPEGKNAAALQAQIIYLLRPHSMVVSMGRGRARHPASIRSGWQQLAAGRLETPRLSLNGIAFGKDGFGLIVGNRGVILRTEDGGTTWKRLKIAPQGSRQGTRVRCHETTRNFHRSKTRRHSLDHHFGDPVFLLSRLENRDVYRLLGSVATGSSLYSRAQRVSGKHLAAPMSFLSPWRLPTATFSTRRVLEKVKKLTEMIERTPGANNYQIFSIARQKVKDVRATAWGIEVQPVMWPECSP